MNTIVIDSPSGLQKILIDILKPISFKKSQLSEFRQKMEFIGTIDNPVLEIKNYGKGVYECIKIVNVY